MATNKQAMIAKDLANKIKFQQYQPGDLLPSESALCELYGTARGTIRKALDQLTELGLIQKVRGKGSVVLDLQRFTFPVSGLTSFSELNSSLGMHAKTSVLINEPATTPTHFMEKEIGALPSIHLRRLRQINGTPVVVDDDYLLTPPIDKVPTAAAEQSIYQYFEGELGLKIAYATKEITVVPASPDIAAKLKPGRRRQEPGLPRGHDPLSADHFLPPAGPLPLHRLCPPPINLKEKPCQPSVKK